MVIQTQYKDMLVNSEQALAIFVEKDEQNKEYDVKAAMKSETHFERRIVILGTYNDEKTAKNVIDQIFEANATNQPTFKMPYDDNKNKVLSAKVTDTGTNTIRFTDGIEVQVSTKLNESFNNIIVEAGTTGYKGGDSGHGGRTYFRIKDVASTDIQVNVIKPRKGDDDTDGGFEVLLGGDAELMTMIAALKFIVSKLENDSLKGSD